MAIQFKMPFSNVYDGVVELGSIEETVWSLVVSHNASGKSCVELFRSQGYGEVKISVKVFDQGINLLRRSEFRLLDGEKNISCIFSKTKKVARSVLAGYVLVHYNLKDSLPSKKEAVTQTELCIERPTSIAEQILPSPQLVNDLALLDNQYSFSDATLVCGTYKILVHRVILSARSPVFAAMFKTQMQEGREGVVDIVDMELDVLQAMLKYVYSGKTDHLTNSLAGDLLFAADKYQLEKLKVICVEELKASMAVNNVFRSLVLGDLHDKTLKVHAVEFICECEHYSDLVETEEWQSLLKERTSLAVEVLTTVVKHVQEKWSVS